ncbi:MAG TPA: SGNH/GDSL hydrolase family protein [Gaiellaceae bacterium]|nr:SGNH/GDSL hydrolase family protein [Gaiellaceae bacterium]
MRALLAAAVVALVLPAGAADGAVRSLRVLFVGNSLTQTNDLPTVVASLARSSGRRLEYRTVAFGGYSLEDHWQQGEARAALASGSWDVVVMQQGPSALPEGQAHLREWAGRFAELARANGTQPALLTVWAESYRGRAALGQVISSYRQAAAAAHAVLLPGGTAWQESWSCDARIPLYGPDGFHPSRLGTYAAALVVYGRLFKAPLVTSKIRRTRVLQKAAALALGRPVRRPCR